MLSPLPQFGNSSIKSVSNGTSQKYQPSKKKAYSTTALSADTFQLQQKPPKFGSYHYIMQESGHAMRGLGGSGRDDDEDKNNPNRNNNTNKKSSFIEFFKKKKKKHYYFHDLQPRNPATPNG